MSLSALLTVAPRACRPLMTVLFWPGAAAISSVTVDWPLATAGASSSPACLPIWDCLAVPVLALVAAKTDGAETPDATRAPSAVRATVLRRALEPRDMCINPPVGVGLREMTAQFIHGKSIRSRCGGIDPTGPLCSLTGRLHEWCH